jgi:hypothetical protein
MPYYLHAKDTEPIAWSDDKFLTRPDAMTAFDPAKHKITYLPTTDESWAWQQRERDRFTDGKYSPVPWAGDGGVYCEHYPDHFAHISVKTPGLIAYTKDPEHGYLDKQTALRPGKYLEKYYRDHFTREDIAEYIKRCDASHLELKFATSTDDIVRLYIGGPRSCMAHWGDVDDCIVCGKYKDDDEPLGHYDFKSSIHPCSVYGDSDLAVAYYGDLDHASARCVVWTEKKIYSVHHSGAYGSDVIYRLLENAGYTPGRNGSFFGAKIQAIRSGNTYVMPYIDNESSAGAIVIEGKTWLQIGLSGLACCTTSGLGSQTAYAVPDDDEDEDTFYCDRCESTCSNDDYGGESMCTDCYNEVFSNCCECEETRRIERMHNTRDGLMCRTCYDEKTETCAVCDGEFHPFEWTRRQLQTREDNGTETLCEGCAETHAYCPDCEKHYEVNPPSTVQRAEFSGDETHDSGIRPIDLIIADNPLMYVTHCGTCKRSITPEGIDVDLFRQAEYFIDANFVRESRCTPTDIRRPIVTTSEAPIVEPGAIVDVLEPSEDSPVFPLPVYKRVTYTTRLYIRYFGDPGYPWPFWEQTDIVDRFRAPEFDHLFFAQNLSARQTIYNQRLVAE